MRGSVPDCTELPYEERLQIEIEELRQQLADRDEQISDLTISSDTYFAERNSARDVWRRASKDRDELRQQLTDSQKREVMLMDTLQRLHDAGSGEDDNEFYAAASVTTKILATTADLSGLILCDATPASYLYKFNSAFGDGTFWSHRPTHNGEDALESLPLYRAWEPKP